MRDYEQRLAELPLRQALWIMRRMVRQMEETGGGKWANTGFYQSNPATRKVYQQAKDFIKKMDHHSDDEYPEKL